MGLERVYPIKIPSKQINSTSYFYNTASKYIKLNPWFITGFSDAEACFTILIQANNKYKVNWRVKPIFTIGLHSKDIKLLNQIKDTLEVGAININNADKVTYSVESFKDLNIIIDHFENYPLVTAKYNDYLLFKNCFALIKKGEHLTEKGLLEIIALKTALNLGLPDKIRQAFPDIVPHTKETFVFKGIPDPFWISGFTSGDGSFNLKIGPSSTNAIGKRIQLRFGIGLHIRELEVIKGIVAYFSFLMPIENTVTACPRADWQLPDKYKYIDIRTNSVLFQTTNFSDIMNIFIPFFDKFPILGQKALDFEDFKEVSLIIKNNLHLSKEGFASILKIKEKMNKARRQ